MSRATRRPSILQSQMSEPLIVVEENDDQKNDGDDAKSSPSSEEGSPTLNPFLLSPFARDIRKHSLPTPQCSGITASQVRRLSERGENAGPGPRQAEFLATLSSAPHPTPGGRRHSVVTISRVPTTMFGRSRRESVSRVLPGRRESIACPPSEPIGSIHNLQLDIMDDIVQARKVRLKLWTESNEKVCEVQPLEDADYENVQRFHDGGGASSRRYSDFVGTTLAPIPSCSKRRASELPNTSTSKLNKTSGIVCSNTDLMSILSSLSTSAMEIDRQSNEAAPTMKQLTVVTTDQTKRRKFFRDTRSNSFDLAIIYKTKISEIDKTVAAAAPTSPSNWFTKRHQPKNEQKFNQNEVASAAASVSVSAKKRTQIPVVVSKEPGKVVWDERSGSTVDAHAFGSAIEDFLRQTNPLDTPTSSLPTNNQRKSNKSGKTTKTSSWFNNKNDSNDDSVETCESSLCSTLKDLFVK